MTQRGITLFVICEQMAVKMGLFLFAYVKEGFANFMPCWQERMLALVEALFCQLSMFLTLLHIVVKFVTDLRVL